MIGLLQKIFVKNRGEAETRTAMGMLCGIVGIVLMSVLTFVMLAVDVVLILL